jgi:hypothetical protein
MVFLPSTTPAISAADAGLKRNRLDYSRHLSAEARVRLPNPIKSIWKAAQVKAGTINMGNGLWVSLRTSILANSMQVIRIIRCIPYAR